VTVEETIPHLLNSFEQVFQKPLKPLEEINPSLNHEIDDFKPQP